MSKRTRLWLGGILFTLMSANFAVNTYSMLKPPPRRTGSYDGLSMEWDGVDEPRVTNVDPKGPGAELKVGDEIIAINGVKFRDDPRILIDRPPAPPGTRFTFVVLRKGEAHELSFRTAPLKEAPQRKGGGIDAFYLSVLLFLLTGGFVFFRRPDDEQAWLMALMFWTITGLIATGASGLPTGLTLVLGFATATGNLFYPLFLHFFLIFPERLKALRANPGLGVWLYLPALFPILRALESPEISRGLFIWATQFKWHSQFAVISWLVSAAYLAAGLLCLAFNYKAASAVDRRRLRVMMTGGAAGFFTFFLAVAGIATGLPRRSPALWAWIPKFLSVTFPLIPLSFVYAIVRHKVIPVGMIIRRGMRYLLVSRGSVLVVLAGVGAVMYFLMDALFSRLGPQSGRTVGIVSAVLAIAVWQGARALHRRVVAPRIDRLFFHQAYDAQQIIAEMAEALRGTTSLPRLLEMVATKIQSALHSSQVSILLRDEASGDYLSAYSCVYSHHNRSAMKSPDKVRLSRGSALVARLQEENRTLDMASVPDGEDALYGPEANGKSTKMSSGEVGEGLDKLNAALLLPIAGNEGLLGVISVGPHLVDIPFSNEDKRLLLSVGGPTSFALENIRLIERTIEDARRRQELEAENEHRARELEGARQLQLSMLPKSLPQLPHVEIAAYMKPAAEVGGDYYDFHLEPDGTLTIAVGDATGHGLKAGTVVTAMKSLFQTYAAEPDLVTVFHRSSRVLKDMNLRSLYMGLTMVKLDGHRLRFSSAGMPPMMIYRANTGSVEEVLIKSMPLGSVRGYPYREQELSLGAGDVVVLMSDGLPERFNPAGEMFDYPRTMETLAEASANSPKEVIDRLVLAGDYWAEGRPQDDDITFVALKVKS